MCPGRNVQIFTAPTLLNNFSTKKTESKFIELSKNKIDAAVNNQKFPGKEKYNRKTAKSLLRKIRPTAGQLKIRMSKTSRFGAKIISNGAKGVKSVKK